MLFFLPHLSSASALPCKIGNSENSALVHRACNTVQLLQRSRFRLSGTMPPTPPRWMHWLQDLGSHTAAWVWVVSQKDWKNQAATGCILQCTNTAFESKMQFTCFPVLPGSAEAQVIWGGIVKRRLIAYFISNISAKKNIKIRSHVSKLWQGKGGTFLQRRCIYASTLHQ